MKYGNYRFNNKEDAEHFYETIVEGGAADYSRVVFPYHKREDGKMEVNPFWKDAPFELSITDSK